MSISNLYKIAALVFMSMTIAACSGLESRKPNTVKAGETQVMREIRYGVLLDVQEVYIEGDRKIGAGVGAAVGGAVGVSGTGSHSDGTRAAAAVAGAVIGGLVGDKVAAALSGKKGVELVIELQEGRTVSIIQEYDKDIEFKAGQDVVLIGRGRGIRVIPKQPS